MAPTSQLTSPSASVLEASVMKSYLVASNVLSLSIKVHVILKFPSLTSLSKACPLGPVPQSPCPTYGRSVSNPQSGLLPTKEAPLRELESIP